MRNRRRRTLYGDHRLLTSKLKDTAMNNIDSILNSFKDMACEMAECSNYEHCRQHCPPKATMDTQNPPYPDFLGRNYAGLVIIGANPGTSSQERSKRQDAVMNAHLRKLSETRNRQEYEALLDFRNTASLDWNLTLCSSYHREVLNYDFEKIAFLNIVKCRTLHPQSDVRKSVGLYVAGICAKQFLLRQLSLLKPRYIVCQWKAVGDSLRAVGYDFSGVEMVGSYNGQHNLTKEKRFEGVVEVFQAFRQATS